MGESEKADFGYTKTEEKERLGAARRADAAGVGIGGEAGAAGRRLGGRADAAGTGIGGRADAAGTGISGRADAAGMGIGGETVCAACESREEAPEACCGCSHKTKERSDREFRDLMNRLKRIEGQVRGLQGMLEKDAYCTDILVQVSAVNAALNSFSRVLLSNHLHTCVAENVRAGNDEVLDELTVLMQKLMK